MCVYIREYERYDDPHLDTGSYQDTFYIKNLKFRYGNHMETIEMITSSGRGSRLHSDGIELYYQEELTFSKSWCSCGTNVSHLLYDTNLSVTKKLDKACGYENWGWANERFITGMQYAGATVNQAQKIQAAYSKCKNKSTYLSTDWTAAMTAMIMIYDRESVVNLSEYHRLARNSKTCSNYKDPNEFLGEHGIPPEYRLLPVTCLIGKTAISRTGHDLDALRANLLLMESMYPTINFIYLPKARLDTCKSNPRSTGTSGHSLVGLKILQKIINSAFEEEQT